jgi:hypothetical protein
MLPPPWPCESQKATKRQPSAWVYNWVTLSLGGRKYRDLVLQVGGLDTRQTIFLCKKEIIVPKSKEIKPGCNLSESS